MANIFNSIQLKRPKRSTFDLSYDHKLSFKMGKLIPVHLQECVPGDKFRISSEAMLRMMPMIAPIMHKVDIYIHHFFVPNRILWPDWETFITGGEASPGQLPPPPPAFPTIFDETFVPVSSGLPDYLGLPVGVSISGGVNALPFAAYHRIWYDYYRDQNLDTNTAFQVLKNGPQDLLVQDELIKLRDRAWEHDYFTSCLPFAQKGAAVELPIDVTGYAKVKVDPDIDFGFGASGFVRSGSDGSLYPSASQGDLKSNSGEFASDAQGAFYDPDGTLIADLEDGDVTAASTINDLRTAFSLQKWLEKNARAGSRYVESILAHFGVRSSDARLQRAEYLGGSKSSMSISEVLQTSHTEDEVTPQGNMAGHGISVNGGKDFTYRCEEHGYIMGIISVRPKTAYMQGLPRHFSKFDRMQYYWPDFAFLGEQEVLNKELMYLPSIPNYNDSVFGYIPRYSEYRYNPSRVSGQMRDTLKFWHMAREFDSMNPPTLSEDFIHCNPTKRIFAVEDQDEDEIVAHIYHRIMATRPMPKYGNPGSI